MRVRQAFINKDVKHVMYLTLHELIINQKLIITYSIRKDLKHSQAGDINFKDFQFSKGDEIIRFRMNQK